MDFKYIFNKLIKFNRDISDENYELSRRRFTIEGCLANAIFTLTSGAFFVGYANYLGASDQFLGIVLSIPLLSSIIQMFSPLLFERLSNRKKVVAGLCFFARTTLASMILIPIITDNKSARLLMLGGMYFTAYLALSFLNPAAGSWIVSLVPENMRGRYFGLRDMCILATSATLSLVMGKVLDIFRANSHEYLGFTLIFTIVFILVILNFLTLTKIKEPEIVRLNQELSLKSIVTMPLKNKKFKKVILLNVIWNLAAQLSIPFFSVYMVTGLKLSYTFIMALGIIAAFMQSLSAKMWGKVSEKLGWEPIIVISIGMIGLCHVSWIFVNNNTYFILLILINIVAGSAWAGINLSFFNIQFQYAPQQGRTVFIGFNAAVAGTVGFVSALIGAAIVGALSGIKINIGITVLDNILTVFGLSGILIMACSIIFSFVFNVWKKRI